MADAAFVYLHGFASGPGSAKARFFGERLRALGHEVVVPDLGSTEADFRELTITRSIERALAAVDRLAARGPVAVIGSSLGGYVAALAAARDARVAAQVLLCPGFDMPSRWQEWLGPERLAAWREHRRLALDHHALGRPAEVGFSLYVDAHGHPPYPPVRCPTLVLHGVHDATVPVETSRRWAANHPGVRLVELDSDHGLLDVTDRLWDETVAFLGPLLRRR